MGIGLVVDLAAERRSRIALVVVDRKVLDHKVLDQVAGRSSLLEADKVRPEADMESLVAGRSEIDASVVAVRKAVLEVDRT